MGGDGTKISNFLASDLKRASSLFMLSYLVRPLCGDWDNESFLVLMTLEFNLFLATESDENLLELRLF